MGEYAGVGDNEGKVHSPIEMVFSECCCVSGVLAVGVPRGEATNTEKFH